MREQVFAMAITMLLVSSSAASAVVAQSNDVTWEGEVEVDGNPATDGAQYQYDISDKDAVESFTINVTGSTATGWDNYSAAGVSPSTTDAITVDGNVEPTDGSGGDPVLEVTGYADGVNIGSASHTKSLDVSSEDTYPTSVAFDSDGTKMFVLGNQGYEVHQYSLSTAYDAESATYSQSFNVSSQTTDPKGLAFSSDGTKMFVLGATNTAVYQFSLSTAYDIGSATYSKSFGVGSEDGTPAGLTFNNDGTKMYISGGGGDNTYEYSLSTAYDIGSATYSQSFDISSQTFGPTGIEFGESGSEMYVTSGGDNALYEYSLSTAYDISTASYSQSITLNNYPWGLSFGMNGSKMFVADSGSGNVEQWSTGSTPTNVDVSDGDGHSHSFGDFSDGQTKTATLNLQTSSTELNLSGSGGSISYSLSMAERTQTEDPTVEVNGNTTSYTGTLADGSAASLSTNTSWIRSGTNRINVSATDPGGSAPTPQVGLDYDHTAADQISVSYSGETWTERYNVSRTYSEARANVSLIIPFSSDRVVAVRDAQYQVNDGGWKNIPEADRSFDGSTLILDVGDVSANDTVEVRANGSKVRVPEGDIEVLQPTTEGDSLETEIQLVTWGNGSYIDVSGTQPDHYLHHAENESWDTPKEYARFRSSGGQELYFPEASSGATARIVTMPLDVDTTGDVTLEVEQAGYEPRLKAGPGEVAGEDVTFSWEHPDLKTGTEYNLYSVSDEKLLASDTAQSPVLFEFDDTEQTVTIREENTTTSSSGGSGGMWQDAGSAVREYAPVIPGEYILIALLLVFGGSLAYSERRSPNRALYRRPMVYVGGLGSLIVATVFIAPSAFFSPLETALQATLPLVGIGAVGITALFAWGWYRRQKAESKPPTIEIKGRKE